MPTRKRKGASFRDGNVGAEVAVSRGFGDVRLWVEAQDGYKHSLYVTTEEAERLADVLDQLLDTVESQG